MNCYNKWYGQKFGRLTVINFSHFYFYPSGKKGAPYFNCICECGKRFVTLRDRLSIGHTKSCGCLKDEKSKEANSIHNLSRHPLYICRLDMLSRCYNEKHKGYKNYGARGIKVCQEWKKDFFKFYTWAIKCGWEKGLTIERNNVNKGYYPHNCSFIPRSRQVYNRRNNHLFTINGITLTLNEWVKKYNVHYKTVKRRIKKGWNPIIAITTPTQKRLTNKVVLNIRNSFLPRKDLAIKYKCSISTIALIKNKTTWANI